MTTYTPPIKDIQFVLHDMLKISESDVPGYADLDPEFTQAILDEAGKIAVNVLHPINATGDTEGCTLENGVVRTPTGFPEAYKTLAEGGWIGLDGDEEPAHPVTMPSGQPRWDFVFSATSQLQRNMRLTTTGFTKPL